MPKDEPDPSGGMRASCEPPQVAAGGRTEAWAPPAPARPSDDGELLSPEQWRALADSLHLSDRELEIVQCLFHDKTERATADDLSVSVNTVHTHLTRLYRKLGVSTRCGLAARVMAAYMAQEA